jgi:hypothetical protein
VVSRDAARALRFSSMALSLPLDVATLPQPVQRVLAPQTPAPLRMLAARGAAPGLRPEHIVTVVVLLAVGDLAHIEPQVQQTAEATLSKLPAPVLDGALSARDLPGPILDHLAGLFSTEPNRLEQVIVHPAVAVETLERLASIGNDAITELIATNEERLLANPSIIEKLYLNKQTRMSTADRILDLAVRNGKELKLPAFREAAEAILHELIAAPDNEPTPDDILFRNTQEADERTAALINGDARALFKPNDPNADDDGDPNAEHEDQVEEKALPLDQQLRQMTTSQKIRTAMLGTVAARALLVRDKNKQVAAAVIKSPMVQENEIATYAASRAVSGEVLRLIAANGDFMKSHTIKYNLASNPKTAVAITLRILPHLRVEELKKLGKSKQIPAQVSKLAKQELGKRKPG